MPETSPGYANLSGFDFNESLAYISHISFLYYRDEFYAPQDFELENVETEPIALNSGSARIDPGNYGTYRIVVKLPDTGETYGLSSYSAMYSQHLFIDEKEYPAVGVPGETADASLSVSIHMLIVEEKAIMLLFPNLPWRVSLELEDLALIVLISSFLLYIDSMFEGALHKIVLRAVCRGGNSNAADDIHEVPAVCPVPVTPRFNCCPYGW